MTATTSSIVDATAVPPISAEMLRAITEESVGPIMPGLVFEVPIVMPTAKKKDSAKKLFPTKAKWNAKVVVEPLKKKKLAPLSS